jgi:hypothetical protein
LKIEVHRHPQLNDAKEHAKRTIDEAAEAARARYLTPGSGQALEYEAAHSEAQRFLSGGDGPFLMLQADVDAGLAPSLTHAAMLVAGMRQAWEHIGSGIRTIRLSGKAQVSAATTHAQVVEIREQTVSALSAI